MFHCLSIRWGGIPVVQECIVRGLWLHSLFVFPQLSADHLVTCVDVLNSFPIVEASNSASVLANVGRSVLRIGALNCILLPRSWCQAARVLLQASANASNNPLPHAQQAARLQSNLLCISTGLEVFWQSAARLEPRKPCLVSVWS